MSTGNRSVEMLQAADTLQRFNTEYADRPVPTGRPVSWRPSELTQGSGGTGSGRERHLLGDNCPACRERRRQWEREFEELRAKFKEFKAAYPAIAEVMDAATRRGSSGDHASE